MSRSTLSCSTASRSCSYLWFSFFLFWIWSEFGRKQVWMKTKSLTCSVCLYVSCRFRLMTHTEQLSLSHLCESVSLPPQVNLVKSCLVQVSSARLDLGTNSETMFVQWEWWRMWRDLIRSAGLSLTPPALSVRLFTQTEHTPQSLKPVPPEPDLRPAHVFYLQSSGLGLKLFALCTVNEGTL